MLKPTEKLDEYISLVTLDFMKQTHYVKSITSVERMRQINTKMGIMALLKLYKGIPLSVGEQELLTKYPFEDDYTTDLEGRIAFIAFNIGKESWNKVNNMRLEMVSYENRYNGGTWTMFDSSGNVTCDDKKRAYMRKVRPSEDYDYYLGYLDEYNSSLIHAWAHKHEISLVTPMRDHIKPVIDFDIECFTEVIPKTSKILSLIRKISKK